MDGARGSDTTSQRLSVDQAATALGITVDAVRSRIKRGTIAHVREGGRVYVLLDADQSRLGHDQGGDQDTRLEDDSRDELLAAQRDEIEFLRRELERRDQLLAAALSRLPALEPPGGPETAADEQQGRGPVRDTGEAQEATERSWWRRMFGG